MSRSTEEWIGKTDDQPFPPRVRLRIFERANGHCQECGRKIMAGDRWVADHTIALINGGENRESNGRCICDWCDKHVKTPSDVAIKAKTYAKQKAYLLPREPGRLQSRGFPKREKQHTATRPPLKRTYAQEEDEIDV